MARPKGPLAEQKLAFARQKAQAKFRGESWQFEFEDWWRAWQPLWSRRGMAREDLCMIRPDVHEPWSKNNYLIVTREQYLCTDSEYYWTGRVNDQRQYARKIPS